MEKAYNVKVCDNNNNNDFNNNNNNINLVINQIV